VLDRIFGTKKTDRRSRELVLLITPRLVRGYRPPDSSLAEFWSGTEGALRLRSPFVQTVVDSAAQAAATPATAIPATAAATTTLAVAAAPPLPPPSPLALSWQLPPRLAAGAESRIELRARSEGALKGASVQLRYDPAQLEVMAVEEGGFFRQGGAKTVFTPRIDAGFGIVSATIGSAEATAKGDDTLVVLRVKPRGQTATTRLQLSSVLGIDTASRRVPQSGGETLDLVFVP
jgi:general secretion pathway protein D